MILIIFVLQAADKDKGCEKPVKTRTKKPVKPVNTTLAVVGEEVQGRPKQQNKATCDERPSKNKATATTNLGAERPYSNPAMGTTNEGGSVPEGSQGGIFAQQGKNKATNKGVTSTQRVLDQARRERRKKFEQNAAWKI